jgi:glycosyltransferase involved in cell wall biosynthesis
MKKLQKVLILMPALNEGKTIIRTINDCLKSKKFDVKVLVIVDSKINKDTLAAAKTTKATIINIGKGLGKGTAIRKAIPYCKDEIVVQLDADYQFIPADLPRIVEPLLNGYDVTLGTRYQRGSHIAKDSVSLFRLFGSYGLSAITSIFAKQRVTDVMAGYKGFKKGVLKKLNPKVDHFGYEAELVLRAAHYKMKILNVPISYRRREVGRTSVSSIKHGFLVLKTIIDVGKENL